MYGSVGVRNGGVFVIQERERISARSVKARSQHLGLVRDFLAVTTDKVSRLYNSNH